MTSKENIETIYGAYHIANLGERALEVLKKNGIKRIDTAYIYVGSEELLGKYGAPKDFMIETKAKGFSPGCGSKESILDSMKTSLEFLKVEQVETYYLHSPDPSSTPLSESLGAINELYKEGKFKHFGISNYSPSQVQEIYDIAKENNYVLPTVYQGSYNAFSRINETDLIPLLRKLNISFKAYSPIAGGLLVKSAQQIKEKTSTTRWDPNDAIGGVYNTVYNKPRIIEALEKWEQLSNDSGIAKGALAYRFIKYHSALEPGDAIIFGATKLEQLDQTCKWLKDGPLPEGVVKTIDQIWDSISDIAPRDNYVDGFLEIVKKQ